VQTYNPVKNVFLSARRVFAFMEKELIKEGEFTYIAEGEGPVLLILHGLFGALSNFKDVLDRFKNDYHVVIPMMPIYQLPVEDTHVRSLAAFINRFVAYKGFNEVNLLGNSLGGHVALVFALEHPELVKTMILTGSSGLYENAMGGSFPRREDYEFIKAKVAYTFYDPVNATKDLVDEVFEIVNNKEKLIRILALAKSAIRHNMANDLNKLHMPVCLIWGKNDMITPPEVAEEFKTLLPNADLYWIDLCGHAPMMERPFEFNNILQPWLASTLKVKV
jgi:2-hydroxy-6-oxonona-2,4-dienedioate hydrolase